MSAPRWTRALLRWMAPSGQEDEVAGDLEEAHQARVRRRGRLVASVLTGLEALDMAGILLRERIGKRRRVREADGLGPGSLVKPKSRVGFSSLDFKLGLRMLVRYPGLTVLGGVSMAFAIFVGAGTFELLTQIGRPTLPFPDGNRLVGISLWDAARGDVELRSAFDFMAWRDEVESIEDIGAFTTQLRNLVTGAGAGAPVTVAEISATAFMVTGVRPHLGRSLREEDELPTAPAVVVVGYDIWQSRLGADPDVIGRTVGLGRVPRTVVGVMPQTFAFPIADHAWIPLQSNSLAYGPRAGPRMQVFGRLAPGVTLVRAQAELTTLGNRAAIEFAETHEHLQPQVAPYARSVMRAYINLPGWASSFIVSALLISSNLPIILFLVLVCGNVALLMFARALTREGEMVVRSALGASRGRIVAQLFSEALVLASVAAVVGLASVSYGLRWVFRLLETDLFAGGVPFWFEPGLSRGTVIYAGILAVLAAAVAGVVPALKVTRGVGAQLRQASAGGGGFRFGGLWTAIIIGQIAVTVVFPVFSFAWREETAPVQVPDSGFAAADYLGARLVMYPDGGPDLDADSLQIDRLTRYQTAVQDLEERLVLDPQVAGVTFTRRLPRSYFPWREIEVDGPSAPPVDERGHRLRSTSVEVDYFHTLGLEVGSGRDFDAGDLGADPGVVIVNESFVRWILGGRNSIGQRIRYRATEAFRAPDQDPGPWLEIIGVVEDLGTISGDGSQGMYHPAVAADIYPVYVIVKIRADAGSFAPRLQAAALDVDPTLLLNDLMTLEHVTDPEQDLYRVGFVLLLTVTSIALLLSLGGVYSIMSCTVSRRTREIGIRIALGSSRRRVVGAILRRPISQVGLGVLCGGALLFAMWGATSPTGSELLALAIYVVFMMAVCMLAGILPMRRALQIEPTEALRADG